MQAVRSIIWGDAHDDAYATKQKSAPVHTPWHARVFHSKPVAKLGTNTAPAAAAVVAASSVASTDSLDSLECAASEDGTVDTSNLAYYRSRIAHIAQLIQTTDAYSKRVRIHLLVLIVVFTVITIVNAAFSLLSLSQTVPLLSANAITSAGEITLVLIPRLLSLLASWLCYLTFSISLMWYKKEPDLILTDFIPEEQYPTVDIFLPRYKEDWNLYGPTVRAALAVNYPRHLLTVCICDDGSRAAPILDFIQPMLDEHSNLKYVCRPDGKDAKAGNLNNALRQAHGQIAITLDADHCALPEFILATLPHLLTQVCPCLHIACASTCGKICIDAFTLLVFPHRT